jgi:hypothetical protein
MIKATKAFLLAGTSALAILAGAAEANAVVFNFTGGLQTFIAPVAGIYEIDAFGASGGGNANVSGGLGAEVSFDVAIDQGGGLSILVGGQGSAASYAVGGGGGGGSFIFFDGSFVLAAVGGGGGGNGGTPGGPGLATSYGGFGSGSNGGVGGVNGTGGSGGIYLAGLNGGGGAGVNPGAAGYGGAGAGDSSGSGGAHWKGGFSGGGGGSGGYGGGGGGGGGSFLSNLVLDPVLTAGVHSGDGRITITLSSGTPAVPEPSTWAMALAGFAGLGWLARMRKRKLTPA